MRHRIGLGRDVELEPSRSGPRSRKQPYTGRLRRTWAAVLVAAAGLALTGAINLPASASSGTTSEHVCTYSLLQTCGPARSPLSQLDGELAGDANGVLHCML